MMARSETLAPSGTAAADLLRLTSEAIPALLPGKVENAVIKLRPYEGWEARMRSLIGTCSAVPGAPNPSSWATDTAMWRLNALRYVLETCHAAGVLCNEFEHLQTLPALDALKARLRPKSSNAEVPQDDIVEPTFDVTTVKAKQTWSGVFLHGIMCSLRTCLYASGIAILSDLNARIVYYSKAERRSVNDRVFLKETYLTGAAALDAFGRIAEAAGHERGGSIRTGARLLAVAADGAPRRAELGRADRRLVHLNQLTAEPEIKVFIRKATSKARRTRILWLRDPRAIRLIEDLCEGPGGHDLLRRKDGQPISLNSADALLRRVTTMALGKPASYNILRRANARAQGTTAGRSIQLGRSLKSTQTNVIYNPDMVCGASATLAMARARARAIAVPGGLLHAVDNIVNDRAYAEQSVNDPKPLK